MKCSEFEKVKCFSNRYFCSQEYREKQERGDWRLDFKEILIGNSRNQFKNLEVPKGCLFMTEYKMMEWNGDEKET